MNQELNQQVTSERRRHGRILATDLRSSLGKILNLSASGMVVLVTSAAHYRIEVEIGDGDQRVIVLAERIWTRRIDSRHMAGFQFIDPPANLLELINGSQLPTRIQRVI